MIYIPLSPSSNFPRSQSHLSSVQAAEAGCGLKFVTQVFRKYWAKHSNGVIEEKRLPRWEQWQCECGISQWPWERLLYAAVCFHSVIKKKCHDRTAGINNTSIFNKIITKPMSQSVQFKHFIFPQVWNWTRSHGHRVKKIEMYQWGRKLSACNSQTWK